MTPTLKRLKEEADRKEKNNRRLENILFSIAVLLIFSVFSLIIAFFVMMIFF